jgi:hypothetical protein
MAGGRAWYTIAQTVVRNTPGQAAGSITESYDGVQVAQQTRIIFRAVSDTEYSSRWSSEQ